MASMTIQDKRIALAKDGTVSLPDADDTIVGKVVRDGKKWTAAVADAAEAQSPRSLSRRLRRDAQVEVMAHRSRGMVAGRSR